NIWFNGGQWPLSWTSITNWTARVPLQLGNNQWTVVGVDPQGKLVQGATNTASAVYSGLVVSPAGQVAINEIMYNPLAPGAEYVELYNNSASLSFDLSGWKVNGVGYIFPSGALIGPNQFLVLAANRAEFAAAYGSTNIVYDSFGGKLQTDGETLTLLAPGTNGAPDLEVSKVRYSNAAPWPAAADGTGNSLQLVDARQDNWRVGNWVAAPPTPGRTNQPASTLPGFAPLWINELQAQNLTGITTGSGQRPGWIELYNPSTNSVSLSGLYLSTNYSALTAWALPGGAVILPGQFRVIFADGQPSLSSSTELHAGLTLPPGAGGMALSRLYQGQPQVLDFVDFTNLPPDYSYGSVPDGQSFDRQEFGLATPGASNTATNFASFIGYTAPGSVYSQTFDQLPNPGPTSVNTANPVTIAGVTYALGNPFDFAARVQASGSGGLGLSSLSGWYGLGNGGAKFGATDGDQTTGGVISFGLPGSLNRALGLLATSSTGGTAFGARFINQTGRTLRYLNVQFTGELWRQSNLPKTLQVFYYIDPSATAPFSTSLTGMLPSLNVSLPTSVAATGGIAVDGTAAANQVNLGAANQPISDWPPGTALWLVWQMADDTGKAQGLAIDNLLFSASDQPQSESGPSLSVQVSGTTFVFSWPTVSGRTYQIEYKDDLNANTWTPLGSTIAGTGNVITSTNDLAFAIQRFFRLKLVP
ncbi:MAG TPA: lamin tail domain-containing protein, partial [Verrucomicrobiae bacterium]|nr:lamin tail domain-containing protein [Verrucomicrobiae bacterium]